MNFDCFHYSKLFEGFANTVTALWQEVAPEQAQHLAQKFAQHKEEDKVDNGFVKQKQRSAPKKKSKKRTNARNESTRGSDDSENSGSDAPQHMKGKEDAAPDLNLRRGDLELQMRIQREREAREVPSTRKTQRVV